VYNLRKGLTLRLTHFFPLVVLLLGPPVSAQSGWGSVQIVRAFENPLFYFAPGSSCDSANLSVKIDARRPTAWPTKRNIKIGKLDVTVTHQVVVSCAGKPQQSFKFRFSDFKTNELCLFISHFYKTIQLCESKGNPSCKCN
jgi:hypothetical protein